MSRELGEQPGTRSWSSPGERGILVFYKPSYSTERTAVTPRMRSTLPGLSRVRNSGVPDGGAGALTTCRGRGACAVILSQAAAMAGQEDPVQREIHQDWANREYIEIITSSIKKISDFLNSFGQRATWGGWEEGGVGGGRRRPVPTVPFLFRAPPAPVPSPRASLGGLGGTTLSIARSRAHFPSLLGPSIRHRPRFALRFHASLHLAHSPPRLQLETPDSSPSPFGASPKPLKSFLSVAPAHSHPPPPAPFGDNDVSGGAGVLSGLGNAFCSPVSASW